MPGDPVEVCCKSGKGLEMSALVAVNATDSTENPTCLLTQRLDCTNVPACSRNAPAPWMCLQRKAMPVLDVLGRLAWDREVQKA